MIPRIEVLTEKKLVGKSMNMTLSQNRTPELWKSFMTDRKMIKNTITTDLYSMQIYNKALDFKNFNPFTQFTKWASIEISDFNQIPPNFEAYLLKGGLYAVFIHKGLASDFHKTFEYIYQKWLPNSIYEIDQREHFEILSDKYKNNDPNSEEEVWIPIKLKEKAST